MTPPRLISALLRWLAPADRIDDVVGDLEETHRRRVERGGRLAAWWWTTIEGLDMAIALLRPRLPRPRMSLLDFRLGVRMLRRYPGLTVVAGLALGFAIAVGALTFEVVTQIVRPAIPLAEGERLVGFRLWNADRKSAAATAADLETWRTQLRSVDDVSAFRSFERNLITAGGDSKSIDVAEISASGFDVARVPALMGRTLVAQDEVAGAPDVIVIAFELWQTLYDAVPDVVGRTARLGTVPVTIVGVMPEHYGFPVAHQAWVPLRTGAAARARRDGPAVGFVFGRLSAEATLSGAQAEIAALGARMSHEFPDTHARVTPEVRPYVEALIDLPVYARLALNSTNLGAVFFLVLVTSNVALLTFARTVSREAELAMRSALGASRGRIVGQLFAETLVLGLVSAAVGLGVAAVGMRWVFRILEVAGGFDRWPFWVHEGLSPMTAVYTAGLAGVVALIAGAGPGFRVTGTLARWKAGAWSGGTVRFGGVWTGVIVTQVALTVACVPIVFDVGWDTSRFARYDLGLPADEYVTARLVLPDDTPASEAPGSGPTRALARVEATKEAFLQEVAGAPGVRSATFGNPPGAYVPRRFIELDGPALPARSAAGHRPQVAAVAPGFFSALGARVVQGRDFTSADAREGSTAVVVNESFVKVALGDGHAVGRRLRIRTDSPPEAGQPEAAPQPWLEIVGVVTDLMLTADPDLRDNAGIYTAVPPAALPIDVIVHAPQGASVMAPKLRAIAARVDPALRLSGVSTLGDLVRTEARFYAFWFRLSLVAIGILLVLSLSGIYAVVSFTVLRRTREIGIRLALGADRRRLLSDVLGKPMLRVTVGAMAGAGVLSALLLIGNGYIALWFLGLIAASAALVVLVSVLACTVPIRRALRIQPTEALRAAE